MAKRGWEKGVFPRMLRHIDNIEKEEILVGVVKKASHSGKGKSVDMATLYMWHDKGTKRTPKRETLKPAIDKYNFKDDAKNVVRSSVDGSYISKLLNAGEKIKKAVRVEIMKIKAPPLKPSTIKARGGTSNPLVDTKQLIKSIGSKLK